MSNRGSQASFDLIILEEVSSKARYERDYQRPIWPGVQSGPTVGIGYDLGHTAPSLIRSDWITYLPADMVEVMASCSGHTKDAGKRKTAEVVSRIMVPWDAGMKCFRDKVLPRWENDVAKILPNFSSLPPTCRGVLTSLAYNRGPGVFVNDGDRYREGRAIKAHMAARSFSLIPAELESMARLWTESGLKARRKREATYFRDGLRLPATGLNAELGASGEGPSVPSPPQPSPFPPRAVLVPGSTLPDVVVLKKGLKFLLDAETGYGVLTEAIVRALQKQKGFDIDGIVGNKQTWPVILSAIEQGEKK